MLLWYILFFPLSQVQKWWRLSVRGLRWGMLMEREFCSLQMKRRSPLVLRNSKSQVGLHKSIKQTLTSLHLLPTFYIILNVKCTIWKTSIHVAEFIRDLFLSFFFMLIFSNGQWVQSYSCWVTRLQEYTHIQTQNKQLNRVLLMSAAKQVTGQQAEQL